MTAREGIRWRPWCLGVGMSLALAVPPTAATAAERGVELISPAESQGLSVISAWGSADVEQAFFATDQFSASTRVATRTAHGWALGAPLLQNPGVSLSLPSVSVDGSRLVAIEGAPSGPGPGTRTDGMYLHVEGQPVKTLFTHPNPGLGNPRPSEYYGADEDVRRLYFRAAPGVVDGPTSASGLYRWNDPANRFDVVEIDDPRVQACGSYTATFAGVVGVLQNGISADGRRVIVRNGQCTVPGSSPVQTVHPHLYVWEDGAATDISRPLPGEADGAATFVGMTPDASRVFFRSPAKLTADSTAGLEELYVRENGQTTRIALPVGWTIIVSSVAASGDGTSLWFAADTGVNGPQRTRLMRWRDGAQQEIAPGSNNAFSVSVNVEVSRDGSAYLIRNATDFTGRGTAGTDQYHRFGDDGSVDCVSCPPVGVPVRAIAAQPIGNKLRKPAISADGSTIAFDTPSAISPRDVNGAVDVYLWRSGEQALLSSGTASGDANFQSMSWDASSVYFSAWGGQVAGVTDPYRKLYVSRVGGGFPPAPARQDCGDDCQGPVTPQPVLPGAGSTIFSGPGNVVPADPPAPSTATTRVRATRPKVARGTRTTVSVRAPGAGQIRTSGWGLRRESRRATRATTYRVPVRLTQRAARTLRSKGTVKTRVTVRFTPTNGRAQTARVAATFRRAANARTTVVRGEL